MQYANVIVNHPAGYNPLTYAIPANLLAHLQIGSVVLVPLGRTVVHGAVSQFIRRVDEKLAPKLKPIKSLVYAEKFVPEYLFEAVGELHKKYGYGYHDLLWSLLPPLPKREQPLPSVLLSEDQLFFFYEYVTPLNDRITIYAEIAERLSAKQQSVLILCASQAAADTLCTQLKPLVKNIMRFPPKASPKAQRDYYLKSGALPETVFIGTRGALITPLHTVGAVMVDEPWLPGHKEESSPRLWTGMVAHALAKARGIPLFFVSSLLWPETRLLGTPRSQTAKDPDTTLRLIPKRPISELLTQFLDFPADFKLKKSAILLKESKRDILWCEQCRQEVSSHTCPTCGRTATMLPKVTHDDLAELIQRETGQQAPILHAEELLQYTCFDRLLVLNFDAYLAVTDFRSSVYLATLMALLRSQAKETLFVTANPDMWTPLIHLEDRQFILHEMALRKKHALPPFGQAVQLSSQQRDILMKLIPMEWDAIIRISKVRYENGRYVLSLLVKLHTDFPQEWFKNSLVKVDILPNYIQ